jgi:hypothetical protein
MWNYVRRPSVNFLIILQNILFLFMPMEFCIGFVYSAVFLKRYLRKIRLVTGTPYWTGWGVGWGSRIHISARSFDVSLPTYVKLGVGHFHIGVPA